MKVDMKDVQEDFKRYQGEIDRLKEALSCTLETLKTANTEGLINDTIWYSDCETLFDFIEERAK
ncbi:MAG: hypothetical protein COB36_11970 [Alphaproteobacteria bacterium]|nr:MAG: hypothetical protein COB36_11970 [Alphaproteobacteria bacterium]